MPEGHTLFALARDLDAAYRGTQPTATSPQGRFAAGAALISERTFLHATSWGKHLFVEFEGDAWLHVHLGLIGTFTVDHHRYAGEAPVVGQVRLRLATEDHVADLRGPNLCAVITPEQVEAVTSRLGPDPLRPEPDPDLAWRRISRSSKTIAELLMDQAVLAGVGNVYRSEVLFRKARRPVPSGAGDPALDLGRHLARPRRPAPPRSGDREDRHRRGAGRGGQGAHGGRPGGPPHGAQLLRLQAAG
ncbi:DNA-formamidopyrimidine glycosylase family protein [Phycicoccus sp. Soil802]|uniref:DNA-formamidopyrimidine glycosylase family protein n=1 Tax=Phycicoccus sp. Soil802 TaxID=1736414 RepID=UPI000ACCA6C9